MIDILARDGSQILWRYRDLDGTSWIVDGQIQHTELCESDFRLKNDPVRTINRALKDWLAETGEGEKWLEENSNREDNDQQI